MTIVKIKSGDWEVEVSTSHGYSYAPDIVNFLTASIESAVKNYIEPKSAIKQSDLDIRDNQIELLKEDLEVVHMYLDDLLVTRLDENNETYSIVGRIKQFEKNMVEQVSNLESIYLEEREQMYSEKEVEKLLETQRENCYVAIYNETQGDQKLSIAATTVIAIVASSAPEPGQWRKVKIDPEKVIKVEPKLEKDYTI
jgi:hypothetical protein